MTILGTRPEIIRLSLIIKKLDQVCEHILVHTGQNYDKKLSAVFFEDLEIREPNYFLGVEELTFGRQIAKIISSSESVITTEKPDRFFILGDTNSSLSAIVAKRMGIPVFHMEAGNRCFDDRVPEEINRRIIDHSSDILMPYTERSRMNLLREGFHLDRIFVVGNPIYEIIEHYKTKIMKSNVLKKLGLVAKKYFLVTMHREENVDDNRRLESLVRGLSRLNEIYKMPIVCSTHPRTQKRLEKIADKSLSKRITFLPPFSFFDFVQLEMNTFCMLTDSGTVQEECCIYNIPNVTIRDVTERLETIEAGSNILSGADPDLLERCVNLVVNNEPSWKVPDEYLTDNVSTTVLKILMAYYNL